MSRELLYILKEARRAAEEDRAQPPTACPNDGEPLERARGVLHCPFCGKTDFSEGGGA